MRAVVLISGGLDSALAVKAIQSQGIEVLAINFLIPFVKHRSAGINSSFSRAFSGQLGCEFRSVTLDQDYLKMLTSPKHGYGKNFNPCIDCKILMLKQARRIMAETKASFIATGEVLGQRPMSQHKRSLKRIERDSGLDGLLVRPLSALLLPVTIPQKKGWLKKEFLFDIKGRGRTRQIALAEKWGVKEYPWPGGGCLLTDPHFCRRLKDLIKYDKLSVENIELLKLGRHFRITPTFKLIVGRDKEENKRLIALAKNEDFFFAPKELPGPTGIVKGAVDQDSKNIAARIIARYTSLDSAVKIACGTIAGRQGGVKFVNGIDNRQLKRWIL